MVEIRTERPGAVLDKLGVTTLTISHQAEHFAVNGLEAILGDIGALVARARGHEETDAFVEEVAKTPSATVVAVTIRTSSGEDLRHSFFQTAIWQVRIRPDGIVATTLWSGPGGESHSYFDACLFGMQMSYELNAQGRVLRHCKRISERYTDALRHSDCATAPDMKCSEEIIGTLDLITP
jgi:hypothetical protein